MVSLRGHSGQWESRSSEDGGAKLRAFTPASRFMPVQNNASQWIRTGKTGLPETDLSASLHTMGSAPHVMARIRAAHLIIVTGRFYQFACDVFATIVP